MRERLHTVHLLGRAVKLVWASGPRWMVLSLALVGAQAILPLVSLLLLGRIVDAITRAHSLPLGAARGAGWREVVGLIVLAGAMALLSSLAGTLSGFVSEGQGLAMQNRMSRVVQRKAASMDLEYFENAEFFNTLHRAQEEAPFRPTRIVNGLTSLAQNAVSLGAIVVLLITLHPLVPLVLLLAALPGLLVRLRFVSLLLDWTNKSTSAERRASYLHYVLTLEAFAKEVRLFGLAPFLGERFDELRAFLTQGRLAVASKRLLADLGVQSFVVVPTFAVLAYIAYRTVYGSLSVGSLVFYFSAIQRAQGAMQGTLGSLLSLHEDASFLGVLFSYLDLQPRIQAPTDPKPLPSRWASGLCIENVSFSYPPGERVALQDVSFSIAPGEVVALVGENGSGKTTLVKLLCRLYDPDAGRITLDGTDARAFDPAAWRAGMSAVFQDYGHYALTLRDNIRVGDLSVAPGDAGAIERAAHKSGADAVAARLPDGYDTLLGRGFEDGEELSIGQWQKIALARAFLRANAPLLILDEPSSALDPRAEAEMFDALHELIRGQSALLISHRLSNVRRADKIVVLDRGRVVEVGTHDELLARQGLYAGLFSSQAKSYLPDAPLTAE